MSAPNLTFHGLLLLAAVAATGCPGASSTSWPTMGASSRRTPLAAWAVNDMAALADRTPRINDTILRPADNGPAELLSAANETVSFQIVVDAGEQAVSGLRVTCTDLAHPDGPKLPASALRAFRMLPIGVSDYPTWYLRLAAGPPRPAGIYDPLVPVDLAANAAPLDAPAGGRLALWIDVAVPRDAEAGTYSASLALRSDSHETWALPLRLKVYPFVLPETRPVPAVGAFGHRQLFASLVRREGKPFEAVNLDRDNPFIRQGLGHMRQLMRLAHEHRLDLFDSDLRPLLKRDAAGKLRLDWDDYDAIALPYLDGSAFDDRLGVAAWPLPLSQHWPDPANYGGRDTSQYADLVAEIASAARQHLAAQLKGGEQVFLWPCRARAAGPEDCAAFAKLAALLRRGDADSPMLCPLPPNPPPEAGWKPTTLPAGTWDILAPPMELYDPTAPASAAKTRHPLKGVWMSPAPPPYLPSLGILASPADVRAMPWFAMRYRCTGLLLPDVLHWDANALAPSQGGDSRLFYPGPLFGQEGPLPSVRLKRLRRGLQDLAYLWILQRRAREGVSRDVINSMVRYAGLAAAGDNYLDPRLDGWVSDGATWMLARRLLAEEARTAVNPDAALKGPQAETQVAWARFHEATRSLRVEQVRAHVTPVADSGSPPSRVEITVLAELFNEFANPVDVTLDMPNPPADFKVNPPAAKLDKVPPGSRATARFAVRAPGPPPIGPDGRIALSLRLRTDAGAVGDLAVGVPMLVVAPIGARPPAIDGSLEDWPVRAGNSGTGFRLLGRRGQTGDGLAKRQTAVFLLRDDTNLYVAFRCNEPDAAGMVVRPNNIVRCEQLLTAGEDLVEVLLDPGAKAAGPEELLRLVVKPNGVVVSDRGIRCQPPLGRVEPWLSQATVASGRQDGVWTVEMAIPLASFGDRGKERFWRANFTRFASQGAEASSWSGAARHFYDPGSLGTMYLEADK